mgnify:CR=1 FL=1
MNNTELAPELGAPLAQGTFALRGRGREELQAKRSILVMFEKTPSFQVRYAIGACCTTGRNFLFGGFSPIVRPLCASCFDDSTYSEIGWTCDDWRGRECKILRTGGSCIRTRRLTLFE